MSRQHTTDVVIVGGGVIGCSIAYQLGKAGAEVIVVEREEVAAEASSAAAGLFAPIGEIMPTCSWQAGPFILNLFLHSKRQAGCGQNTIVPAPCTRQQTQRMPGYYAGRWQYGSHSDCK